MISAVVSLEPGQPMTAACRGQRSSLPRSTRGAGDPLIPARLRHLANAMQDLALIANKMEPGHAPIPIQAEEAKSCLRRGMTMVNIPRL